MTSCVSRPYLDHRQVVAPLGDGIVERNRGVVVVHLFDTIDGPVPIVHRTDAYRIERFAVANVPAAHVACVVAVLRCENVVGREEIGRTPGVRNVHVDQPGPVAVVRGLSGDDLNLCDVSN